jgi:NAD(P)-dependent dehydrogenase (short-subunit alcohol dehydrogenase family)
MKTFTVRLYVAEAFQRTTENFGTLNIVVNNAGILDEREWEKEVYINLVSHVRVYCTYIYREIYGKNMR